MRLITGRTGSARAGVVLDCLRAALRSGDQSVRLLVPTATLAQHWQNLLAREGFVVRGEIVQTLSHFINGWAQDLPAVSETALYLLVERAVRAANRPEFARVAGLPGFGVSIARTIAEFSAAGCDSARLRANLPSAPLAAAFLAVYGELENELARNGRALRAQRLERAAARIDAEGPGAIRSIWLDGFEVLPEPELRVLAALERHAEITIVSEDEPAFAPLLGSVIRERLDDGEKRDAQISLFRARSIDAECAGIARRIQAEARAGRPLREIGIVVRPVAAYVPALRTALDRAGIPARFYFDSPLDRHPAVLGNIDRRR
jgi:ATP-dependent helicase/DNAse subunit B